MGILLSINRYLLLFDFMYVHSKQMQSRPDPLAICSLLNMKKRHLRNHFKMANLFSINRYSKFFISCIYVVNKFNPKPTEPIDLSLQRGIFVLFYIRIFIEKSRPYENNLQFRGVSLWNYIIFTEKKCSVTPNEHDDSLLHYATFM